jgi:lipid-A-disaccharide synthase
MKFYIIAGEASGDLHASNLVREMKSLDPDAQFRGWGGDLMSTEGVFLVRHFHEVAFMGFTEVVTHLGAISSALKQCKSDILEYKPDAVILVDYPGFNLRIAEFCHEHKIRVIYYISPQIWAWKQSRVHKIRRNVDKMLVILPFEEAFYRKFDFKVTFVGHPLLDVTARPSKYSGREEFITAHRLSGKPVIALLPGSRRQEITRMLPVMARMAGHYPGYDLVVAGAPSQERAIYERCLGNEGIRIIYGETYELLRYSTAGLITSGTATLETALLDLPEVVCYKGSAISYQIARRLVKISYISLVNLVMEREVVKELIQDEFKEKTLKAELDRLLDPENANRIKNDYQILKKKLGEKGASLSAASEILGFLKLC